MTPEQRKGVLLGASAYVLWGVSPIYFKAIAGVPSLEALAHRVVWSVVFLLGFLALKGRLGSVIAVLRVRRAALALLFTAALISVNWLIFIYAVASGQTLEASFGYFMNPVITIAMGVVFFRERLSRVQLVSLGFAVAGVAYQLVQIGRLPWIALALACTFAVYGLVRKKVNVPSLEGLTVETLVVLPVAALYLAHLSRGDSLVFLHQGPAMDALLIAAGLVTSVPLVLFSAGARLVPYSWMGFLQYVAPSMQFAMAVFVFGEHLDPDKLLSFGFVWAGLAVMLIGGAGGERARRLRRIGAQAARIPS